MCADINATYANISIETLQSGPSRNYSASQYQLGDVITITVTAVSATGGAVYIYASGAGYPGVEPDAITPSNISIQNIGAVSTTVTDMAGPSIYIGGLVGSAAPSGVPTVFSITCTSVTPLPPPVADIPSVDPLVSVVQQTHTALVSSSLGVPSIQQRSGMARGSNPGNFAVTPSESGVVLNYATSLIGLQNHNAAGDAAYALANADPMDQPFNFWIDGSGSLHARTTGTVDYWGSFGMLSLGADYLVSQQVMVGIAAHIDTMRDTSATTDISAAGLMAGPYLSAEITDNVFLDLAAYYGRSWTDVISGDYRGDFETQRFIASGNLKGDMALGDQWTLTPQATLFYMREMAKAYTLTDSLGNSTAGNAFDTGILRISAGAVLAYQIDMGNGDTLTPSIGGNIGLMNQAENSDIFGNASTGLNYEHGSTNLGASLDASADGTSFRSIGARASARMAF